MKYANREITPEAALRDLTSDSPRARLDAADALGRVGEAIKDEACPALRRALQHDDAELRYTAALSLGELRDRESVPALIDQVEGDGHPMPRQAAVIALGLIGDPRATSSLRRALRSDSPDVRFQATSSLAQVDPEGAGKQLRRALKDSDPEVRGSAAAALGDLGDGRAADALAGLLDDAEPGVQMEAAVTLARLGDRRGTPLLVSKLSDRRGHLLATEHLYRCPDPEATLPLQEVLGRWLTPALQKVWAAAALCRLDQPQGRAQLLASLGSRRQMVRGLTIELLGELGAGWATDALRQLAASPDGARWREEIDEALGE